MRGKHHVIVESDALKYEFDIRRNITVIQGDSATGKTTLIELLSQFALQGKRSGIRVESDVPCFVYTGNNEYWKAVLQEVENSLVFIDEDYSFVFTVEFARYLQESSNYYIIIIRRPLKNLSYSIREIYGIRTSGRFHFPDQVYHEFYPLYTVEKDPEEKPEMLLLVENRNAGYQFYQKSLTGIECISANGNSNIFPCLLGLPRESDILVIADGASFGAFVDEVVKAASEYANLGMFFPESFEWMLLKSGLLEDAKIEDILKHPEDFIDSSAYVNWERYFTKLLEESTMETPYRRYHKDDLPDYYTLPRNTKKIFQTMPESLQQSLKKYMS